MKRKFTLLIAALALLTMIVQPGKAWGQTKDDVEVSWTASEQGYTNAQDVGDITIDDHISGTFAKNSGTNGPKYYTSGESVRMYNLNSLTITPDENSTITAIIFTLSQSGGFSVSTGEYSVNGSTGTWSGSSTGSIVFTNGSTQNRIQVISVTYTYSGTPAVTHTLTYSANPTEGGTVTVGNTTIAEGATTSISATAKAGYVFGSWTVEGEGSSVNEAGDTFTMGTEDATLIANFTAVTTYTVTYHANVTGIDDIEVVYNEGEDVTVAANTFSNPGHAFTEWNTQADGDGDPYVAGDVIENIQADIDLYAQWEESSETTATLNIESYGTAQEWDNGTKHTSITIDGVTFTASEGSNTGTYYNNVNPHQWRFYQSESATITISVPDGNHLVSITPTYASQNSGVLLNGSATIQSGSSVAVSGTSVTFSVGNSGSATNGQVRFTNIDVTYASNGGVTPPSISADDVNIAYDATSGSITYTINNGVEGGILSAATDSWLTLGEVGETVPFTCSANEETTARTATVTLTYTYNTDQTVTKDVTVTQAAAPVVYSTIPELFAAATTTETSVEVTFNDWVVSGVSTNGKNVFVTDNNGNGFVIFDNDGDLENTYTAGDILTGTAVSCSLKKYNGFAELLNVDATDLTITAGGTVTAANVAMADLTGVNTGALLHYDNLTCSVDNNKYYLSDGTTTLQVYNALYAFDALENGKKYNITGVYQQYNSTKEILPRSADDIEEVTVIVPTIIVLDDNVDIPAEGGNGALTVSYENITDIDAEVYFCDAQGAAATYSWISADIDTDNNVEYTINPNDGEARTAYFKVHQKNSEVYSNLVTVSQDEYVVPTYAALPFEFTGGKADIENTDGLYQEGLGSDYSGNNPKLKFDSTDDWLLLQFNEKPGTLTFDIKGNSFSDGTFTVQTSENGETFTDLKNYTNANFGNILYHEEFTNLGENVRYIKWIYTEKANGNVALGNINLAEYVEPVLIPSITVDPAAVSADAEEHDGTLDLTYENLTITSMDDFDIQYYDAQGEETTEPDWVEVSIAEQDPTIGEGYVVSYYMIENEGDARTAYFKVYAMGDNTELVYSNLVTINQAAPETPVVTDNYELYSGALVEGDYLIVYEDYAMNNVVDSDRLQYAEVEITEGVISTDNAAIVWHIAQSGEYWTIYSADANSYAAGTGVKNKAQMLEDGTDDMAMWTVSVSGTETYNFVNKANTEAGVNAYLRNNGTYGFACYAAGTGGPLSLYKKQDNTPSINLSSYSIEAPATVTIEVLTITPANIENFDINYLNADYCNPDGSAIEGTKPDFVEFDFSEDEGYKLTCTISDNDGDARTAYFKVIYELGENDYVYSNVVTVNQAAYVAPVATITVNPYLVEVTKDETDGTLSITLENIEITEAGDGEFSVYFCDAYGEILPDQSSKPDWIGFDFLYENDTWSLYYLIGENETFEPRTAYIKVYGLGDDATTDAYSNLITFTQATAAQTYTLVTSVDDIVPGKHYIIAGIYNNEYYAMAGQATNNRSQVKVTASNEGNTITEVDGLYEFVFSGDNTNNWTIYDETNKGYLYAAGTGSSNQLKYQAENNDRGIWTISINDNNEANVTSITTLTERKIMRYNSGSNCFSCYGSGQNPIYIYMKDNDTSDPVYYSPSIVTVTENIDAHETPVVVLENEILTLTGSLTSSSPDDIVINDGGQLVFNGDDVQATVKKQTIGGTKADHWYTIASPVANNKFGEVTNLTSATYDLYRYNETTSTWENYKETAPEPHAGFYYGYENSAFEAGRGYLYYNAAGSELSFAGILNNDGVTYDLTAGTTSLAGINLMGNPFTQAITLDDITLSDGAQMSEGCYVLTNADGWGASIESINPCEGFLVRVDKNTTATISKPTSGSKSRANRDYIAFTVANSQYEDVTYAMFSKGLGLDKINHRNADIPMVYIPQDGKNYAIATMSDNTEMFNLNFKAMTTGKYTLSYKAQGTYSYLHVIDRFTGEDIDMLVEGEYSFIGSSYDNDARFIVKLSYNANIGEFDTNSIFAYQNGDEIIVNGEGQLQVYDVMGRFVQCINVNGTESISASQFSDAVYIFRMIGETVKTQKIVVR